jgi:hypothetical protein
MVLMTSRRRRECSRCGRVIEPGVRFLLMLGKPVCEDCAGGE